MKKEYLILTLIILALCTYLYFHKDNRDNYSLPRITKTDTDQITGIDITQDKKHMVFSKKADNWTLTENEFPADPHQIENLLNAYKSFNLTSLISEQGDLNRYELDDKQGIKIRYHKGEEVVFEVMLGKTAPTFRHTFVKLSGDKNIYHASGSLRSEFEKDVENFRDKKALTFNKATINQLIAVKDDISKTLTLTQTKNDKKQDVISWNFEDGTQADLAMLSDLLTVLSDLRCETYPADASIQNLKEQNLPFYQIIIKDKTDHSLTLYKGSDDDHFLCVSSMNRYIFTLNKHNENEIITSIEKLLGIYKPEDPKA